MQVADKKKKEGEGQFSEDLSVELDPTFEDEMADMADTVLSPEYNDVLKRMREKYGKDADKEATPED